MKTPLTDVIDRLKKTRSQDRKNSAEVFAAAANLVGIAEGAIATTATLIEEFTPAATLEAAVSNEMEFGKVLEGRLQSLRAEADELLITAHRDKEIDRVIRLEALIDLIYDRLKSLSLSPNRESTVAKEVVEPLDTLSVAQLRERAKQRGFTGCSKLNKAQLIALLSQASSK